MGDSSLRQELDELAESKQHYGTCAADKAETGSCGCLRGLLEDLLAAHPAEPAPDRQPSDAAVEAAARAIQPSLWDGGDRASRHAATARDDVRIEARAALEAAYRVDAPRLNRGALSRRIEEIVDRSVETGVLSHNELVDAVFELLNGTES